MSVPPMPAPLRLSEACQHALGQLRLQVQHAVNEAQPGGHVRRQSGASLSFREHRAYVPGDDVRHLDWHVLARTGRAHIKLYAQEAQSSLLCLLDTAPSMYFGAGTQQKLQVAAQLLLGLGTLALRQGDAAGLHSFAGRKPPHLPCRSGKAQLGQMGVALAQALQAEGQAGDTAASCRMLAQLPRAQRIVLCSDWLQTPQTLPQLLQALAHRAHIISVVHVMHPQEATLDFSGTQEFYCPQTQQTRQLNADDARPAYLQALQQFVAGLKASCAAGGATYVPLHSADALPAALRTLAGGGVLRQATGAAAAQQQA